MFLDEVKHFRLYKLKNFTQKGKQVNSKKQSTQLTSATAFFRYLINVM